jgi:hypothetical protein
VDEADLTPEERALVAGIDDVLADPALWAEPSPGLEDRVVAAIAGAGAGTEAGAARRWLRYAVAGVAAAVLLVGGVAIGVQLGGEDAPRFSAALTGTDLAPDATGDVTMTKTASGWRIELHATGLPRRADGEFYEAWLKDGDGRLVPIGTFNDGREVVLWAGVPPSLFPTMTVTRERADGDQASSGEVVLAGHARAS